jgi:putative MATE family efflux protein
MREGFFSDREFFSTVLRLAVPIATQQLVINGLNAVDVLLIGQLGDTSVAAVGLANQFFFVFQIFLFGIGSGSAVFTAQFWGRGDVTNLRRILGLGLVVALSGAVLFTAAAVFAPRTVMDFYTDDPAVIAVGARYLRIVGLCYIPTAITVLFGMTLRSARQVKVPMVVSIAAITFKTVLAYMLIFGLFGLPALGVIGAALATLIARFLEAGALLFVSYRHKLPVAARLSELLSFNRDFVRRFAYTTSPVVVGEILWALGITSYSAIYARISTDSVAAVNIASTIEGIAVVPFLGLANACAIILGNAIGGDKVERADDYARRFLALAIASGVVMGALVFVVSRFITGAYRVSPETQFYAQAVMTVMACVLWIKAANMMTIVGIMRSGGDTRYALAVDTMPLWFIGVPLALFGAFVLHLPVYGVVLMVAADEATKFVLGVNRVRSGKWLNNVVRALS